LIARENERPRAGPAIVRGVTATKFSQPNEINGIASFIGGVIVVRVSHSLLRASRANPPGHKGRSVPADEDLAQAKSSAEADRNRQARLLLRRQRQAHAESRTSPAQRAKQHPRREFSHSHPKEGADDAGISIVAGIAAVRLNLLPLETISFRPVPRRSALSTHFHRPNAPKIVMKANGIGTALPA